MGKGNVMRTKAVIFLLVSIALGAGMAFGGEMDRPHIGIMLDPQPLPELLVKHLRLVEGEGAHIINVVIGGPADKAGIDRDDIVVGFEGKKADSSEKLIEELMKLEIGQEATLEIIHLGQRKPVKLKLDAIGLDAQWKYHPEPDVVQQWQPGRIFRRGPGQQGWIQMPFADIWPKGDGPGNMDITSLFKQRYGFRYSEGGQDYEITIEGDPQDEDTIIIVKIDKTEYKTAVKDIDKLPQEYRKSALDALEKAKKQGAGGGFNIKIKPETLIPNDKMMQHSVPGFNFGPGSDRFEQLEQKIREMQKRMEQLEKQKNPSAEGSQDKATGSLNIIIPPQRRVTDKGQKT